MRTISLKISVAIVLLMGFFCNAQEINRFQNEVEALQKKYDTLWNPTKETIVFTGSSSIRLWTNLNDLFPKHQIINTGFGASQSTDLLLYSEELILDYNPYKVFIYEGDNDLASNRKPNAIIDTTKEIIASILKNNSKTKIVLISAKPSVIRWSLKRKYIRLNRKLKRLSEKNTALQFADVWSPMLVKKKINENLFEQDGLHINLKGYEIWYSVIKPFINN